MSLQPPISKWVFGANIVTVSSPSIRDHTSVIWVAKLIVSPSLQPLAQVTVVDGDEGDCNVVDFCRLATMTDASTPPKIVYQDEAWRRTIIDTGPAGGQKAINIVATLELLATQQSYPALATDQTWSEIPVLDELQVRDRP